MNALHPAKVVEFPSFLALTEDNRLNRHWYVLRPTINGDYRARDEIAKTGLEVFLPTYKRHTLVKHTKGVRRERELPLLRGYLFARIDYSDSSPDVAKLDDCRHLHSIVKPKGAAAPVWIKPAFIDELRHLCVEGTFDQGKHSGFQMGDRVRITHGPFAGLVATFKENRPSQRLRDQRFVRIVLDTMFSGKIPVDIEEDSILAA